MKNKHKCLKKNPYGILKEKKTPHCLFSKPECLSQTIGVLEEAGLADISIKS